MADAAQIDDWITAPAPAPAAPAPAATMTVKPGPNDWVTAPKAVLAMGSGTPGPDFDPTSQPFARDDQSPSNLGPAAGRIANAAVQGWQDTPSPLSTEAEAAVNDYGGPIGRQIINPGLKVAAGVVPGPWNPNMNAGMAAISQAAMEAFGEKGGRDALALLASAPMLHGEVPKVPDVAAAPVEAASATPMFDAAASQFTPDPYVRVTALDVLRRDAAGDPNLSLDQAYARARAENRAGAAEDAARAARVPPPTPAAIATTVMGADNITDAINAATTAVQAPATSGLATRLGAPEAPAPVDAGLASRLGAPDAGDLFGSPAEQASPPGLPAESQAIPASGQEAGSVPVPQSVGASASRDMTPAAQVDLSTRDMKANRYQAEMDTILAPPTPGDAMVYVPGSLPTLAERSGDPIISQTENLYRQRRPDLFVGEGVGGGPAKPLTANNNARVALYDSETPPRTTINTMRDDRAAQWAADSKATLPGARPIDFAPVSEWVEDQLNDPTVHENDAIRGVLEDFQQRLFTPDGNLKTDPAAAWGIHNQLQNQLDAAKDPLRASSAEKYAFNELMTAKAHVDAALNAATDNRFQTALDNFATRSQAINAAEELEAYRPKLTNGSGQIQAASFHRFVISLAELRGRPGVDPAMSISDGTMGSLIAIDTDLKRAGLIKLGGAAGSDTNLLNALANTTGVGAAHAVLGGVPVVGRMVGPLVKFASDKYLETQVARHLAPPEGGYTYPEEDVLDPALVAAQRARGGQPPPAAAAAPAPPPGPRTPPGGAPAVGVTPIASALSTPNGTVVPGRYVIREMRDVIASQRRDGADNPAYDQTLQPRDRSRKASVAQVADMAANPRFGEIGFSNTTATGAPVIGRARSLLPGEEPTPDNPAMVESGNARTMMQDQIYGNGGPNAAILRASVAEHAKALGQDISGMSRPALFFERSNQLDPVARAKLADDMGAQPVASLSATERAAGDARRISNDTLSMIQPGDVTLAKNVPFARAFADQVVPPAERPSFITADGELSQEGAARIRAALAHVAYENGDLVTALAEDADNESRALGDALLKAAGPMAKLRGAINDGTVSAVRDIAPDLVAAAELVQAARRGRYSLADAVGQMTMLTKGRPAETEAILQYAYGPDYSGRISGTRFAMFLSDYAEKAQVQSGLFGVDQTTAEILGEAGSEYGYGRKTGTGADAPGAGVSPGPGDDLVRQARGASPVDTPGPENTPRTPGGDAGQAASGTNPEVTPPARGLMNSSGKSDIPNAGVMAEYGDLIGASRPAPDALENFKKRWGVQPVSQVVEGASYVLKPTSDRDASMWVLTGAGDDGNGLPVVFSPASYESRMMGSNNRLLLEAVSGFFNTTNPKGFRPILDRPALVRESAQGGSFTRVTPGTWRTSPHDPVAQGDREQ